MAYTRRARQFVQELVIMAFDHIAPGQGGSLSAVAATGTLTCDTKANSTALDYFILNDGQNKAMIWYDTTGSIAAKFSKTGSKATATLTCDTKANTVDDEYFTVWDGHGNWVIILDVAGDGDGTGTGDIVVDISGATTAADVAALIHADINADDDIHITSTDNADGTLTLTIDDIGYQGNGANTENASNAWAITNFTGGTDVFPAEEFASVDISADVTAADVAAGVHAVINALTEVKITSTDNADGTLTLTNDEVGAHGNASQQFSETGSTLMALTDMTGGADADTSGATMAVKLFTAQKKMRIDKVEYINPTGLAAHAANYWDIGIKIGATSAAEWSTDSAAEGALVADTVNNMTLSATDANRVADSGDVLSFYATKVASAANLPAGRVVIHGRYL